MADDFCKEFKFFSAIAAYCFFEKKPAIDVNFVNDWQLSIFESILSPRLFIIECKKLRRLYTFPVTFYIKR